MTATDVVTGPETSGAWFDPTPLPVPPAKKAKAPKPPKPARVEREPRVRRRGRFSSAHALPEISLLAVVLFGAYVAVSWWMKYPFHYAIGDSLARTADAKFMLFSRDPHAAAIGVYWMPLPTFSELPFMLFCSPLHHAEFAGPLSTAMWSSLTVLVLGRIGRDLGVGRKLGFLICLLYALDPIVVFYAANGMSEAAEFFFTAGVLWGMALVAKDRASLAGRCICGLSLAGLVFSKYEAAPAVAVVMGVVVLWRLGALRRRRWHGTVLDLLLMVGPAILTGILWLLYLKLITGSFTTFLTAGAVTGSSNAGTISTVQAASGHIGKTAAYVLHYAVGFGLGLAALLFVAIWGNARWRILALGTLGMAVALIIATSQKVYVAGTLGNPRYFTPVVVVACVATLVAVGVRSSGDSGASRLVAGASGGNGFVVPAVVLALLVGSMFESVRLERGNTQSVEHESRVFDVLAGHYDLHATADDYAGPSEAAAKKIDSLIKPGQRVLLDTRFENGVALYTQHLNQFIITSDRDYERIVAPDGVPTRIDWAIAYPASGSSLSSASANDDAGKMVGRQQGWTLVWSNIQAAIWKRDPKLVQQEAALAPHNG